MANNYLEFSESIEHLTPKELKWWENKKKETSDAYDTDPEGTDENDNVCPEMYIQSTSKSVWFHPEESGNVGRLGIVIKQFLKLFRPTECFCLTWAEYCDKPRIGEFSGGAMFVTADSIEFLSCEDWLETTREKWRHAKKTIHLNRPTGIGKDPLGN